MKKIFILVLSFSLVSYSAFSQKNPPEAVKKAFTEKYAAAQSVKWDSEEKTEWEAEFKMGDKKMSASFEDTGKFIESETAISEKELPAAVISTLNKDFQGYKRGPVEIYENAEIKGFELGLKKRESVLEVIFDNNGKIIKKSEVKEEDEKTEKGKKEM